MQKNVLFGFHIVGPLYAALHPLVLDWDWDTCTLKQVALHTVPLCLDTTGLPAGLQQGCWHAGPGFVQQSADVVGGGLMKPGHLVSRRVQKALVAK